MPFYDYICPCGKRLTLKAAIEQRDEQTCEGQHCGEPQAEARQLQREEIPEGSQRMSYNWAKWSLTN